MKGWRRETKLKRQWGGECKKSFKKINEKRNEFVKKAIMDKEKRKGDKD